MENKKQLSGHYINCENCGKEIYQTNTQYNRAKHHFCSNKCQKIFQHNLLFEVRKCEMCNNTFEVSKKSTKRFCSTECQNKWQKTLIGDLNPRSNKINYMCDFCNQEIKIIPCNFKRFKHHFCSDKCRVSWYSEVFSKDEVWREESRKRAIRILEDGNAHTDTKPQIIVNNILDDLNIEYINEKGFTYYAVDNYLPKQDLIIEVMGDFWHGSPLKYELENLRDIQKRRIYKDKSKHTYIKNYYHKEILYLWEYDILNNPEKCKELILLFVRNNGKLVNYHSFNYNYENDNITLNNDLITSYQDINIA